MAAYFRYLSIAGENSMNTRILWSQSCHQNPTPAPKQASYCKSLSPGRFGHRFTIKALRLPPKKQAASKTTQSSGELLEPADEESEADASSHSASEDPG